MQDTFTSTDQINTPSPVVDGVPWIYPAWLYQPEGSPLHFLQKLRDYDLNTYNDPLIQDHSMSPSYLGSQKSTISRLSCRRQLPPLRLTT